MISKAKQLASITAAGVSAIALTGGKAEAGIIYSAILNTSIGFSSNAPPTTSGIVAASRRFATFASGPVLKFRAVSYIGGPSSFSRRIEISRGGAKSTTFGYKSGRRVVEFPFGATWGAAAGHSGSFPLALGLRVFGPGFSGLAGFPTSYTDQYYLFRFNGTAGFEYGWVEASMSVTNSQSAAASDGPSVTIVQYAFDNTGAQIPAGETPEPSSIAESGLAALILGAEGLRRWRKARKAILPQAPASPLGTPRFTDGSTDGSTT